MLSARSLCWTVGIPSFRKVYPAEVQLILLVTRRGRPRVCHVPNAKATASYVLLKGAKWRQVSWRTRTKGRLTVCFAAVRAHC